MAVDWSEAVVAEGEVNLQSPDALAMLAGMEYHIKKTVEAKKLSRLDALCCVAHWFGQLCAAQGVVFPQSRDQVMELIQQGYDGQRRLMVLKDGGGNA